MEEHVRKRKIKLSNNQINLLEHFSSEFRERHIVTNYTGELVAVDTFMVGTLKRAGRVYLQAAIDCHSRYAWGAFDHQYRYKLPRPSETKANEKQVVTVNQKEGPSQIQEMGDYQTKSTGGIKVKLNTAP